MAIDERSRHILFLKLEEVLGSEEATILMEHLPPVGWADVATKHDLDQLEGTFQREHRNLEAAIRREIEHLARANAQEHQQLEERITLGLTAAFRAELITQTRTMIFALLSSVATMAGVFIAIRLL
ncbi:MAG TPA: hypothetical protein VF972_08470 [Actinomycetota bacterium]